MRRFLLPLLVILLVLGTPLSGTAQVPVMDARKEIAWLSNVILHIANAYKVAVSWRDNAIGKMNSLRDQASELVNQRKMWERRAYGELAGIGKGLPDWTEYANFCNYETDEGLSACGIERRVGREITRLANRKVDKFTTAVFDSTSTLRNEVRATIMRASGDLETKMFGGVDEANRSTEEHVAARAERALKLETLSEELSAMVDSVFAKEDLGNAVSSGRAKQIRSRLLAKQALVELEVSREHLLSLRQGSYEGVQKVHDLRLHNLALYWRFSP